MSASEDETNAVVEADGPGDVLLATSVGEFRVELYWQHAPRTCQNFYELAKRGALCHVLLCSLMRPCVR